MKKINKKSRPVAAVCLAVVILLSVFLGGYRSVKHLEKKACDAYFNDSIRYGDASEDMKKMSRYAAMLSAVCVSCGCDSNGFAETAERFDKAVGEPYMDEALYESLFRSANLSYNLLINSAAATEQQKISAKQYFYEMDSASRRLANNEEYNDLAAQFNKASASFPVSLIWRGNGTLIVFD